MTRRPYDSTMNNSLNGGGGRGGGMMGKRQRGGMSGGGGGGPRGDYGGSGANTDHTNELRILIPSKYAGGIIGKGGEMIKRLRADHNIHLNIPDSQSPERVVHISYGQDGSYENILACLKDVLPKVVDKERQQQQQQSGAPAGAAAEIRMLVHQSHAGALIGKGGSRIKEMRESCGIQMKVFATCAPVSTDRVVLIAGDADKVIQAVNTINETLKEIPTKGIIKPYDSINWDPSFANEYGGLTGSRADMMNRGGGGMMDGAPPPPYANTVMPPSQRGGGGYGGYQPPPPPPQHHHHQYGAPGSAAAPPMNYPPGAYHHDPYAADHHHHQPAAYGMPPPPAAAAPPPGQGGSSGSQQTQVTIPNELAGTIIGRGGERIANIRRDSGAHILVHPPEPNSEERIITIGGTETQIQMAQYLLQQCVRQSAAGRRYIEMQQGQR